LDFPEVFPDGFGEDFPSFVCFFNFLPVDGFVVVKLLVLVCFFVLTFRFLFGAKTVNISLCDAPDCGQDMTENDDGSSIFLGTIVSSVC